jgi:hypothetical protein
MRYDPSTRTFYVQSYSRPDQIHEIIYRTDKHQWYCNCDANIFRRYELHNNNKRYGCIHILCVILYRNEYGIN